MNTCVRAGLLPSPALTARELRSIDMGSWKCSKCGYQLDANTPPEQCPSCKEKCEFVDNTCYTPDCEMEGIDKRIGPKS